MTTATFPPPSEPPVSTDAPPAGDVAAAVVQTNLAAPAWNVWRLALLGGGYIGALIGSLATRGIPLDREQVLAWMIGAMAVVALSSPQHRFGQVVLDWLPFLAVLVIYDYSRGFADTAGMPIQWTPQIRADEILFGGTLPTVWLQARIIDPNEVHPWEVVTSLVYVSHFVVPFVVAGYLWVRNRQRYLQFARRFVVLSFLGVLTFITFPAAPPWLASREGYIDDEVSRSATRGWRLLGLEKAQRMLEKGQASVNLTAAIPSLHAGYSALIGAFLWPGLSWRGRLVVVAYALIMGFTLVMGGEHYVVDVFIGWAYVAITLVVVGWAERWWATRRGTGRDSGGAEDQPPSSNSSDQESSKSEYT